MSNRAANPSIHGVPAAGLGPGGWAGSGSIAAAGAQGELKTADVLDRLALDPGPVVLHDLRVPEPGARANIDHAVVAGQRVWLIDSKHWAPGFVWGRAGTGRDGAPAGVRRGGTPFEPASKLAGTWSPSRVTTSVREYLAARACPAREVRYLVVAWPTRYDARMSLWALRVPGARVVHGDRFARMARSIFGLDRADPLIVRALAGLVTKER